MFIIPSYQRPYVWRNEDVIKLLDDFIGTPGTEKYYIGTILMHAQRQQISLFIKLSMVNNVS